MEEDLTEVFDVGFAAIDGAYGWVVQSISVFFFVIVFNFFVKSLLIKLYRRFELAHREWEASFAKALYRPLSAYVWLIAAIYSLDIISHQIWEQPLLTEIHLVLTLGAIIAISWFLLRWNNNIIRFMIIRSKKGQIVMDQGKIDIIGKLITVLILFMTVLLIMEALHRSMQTLIAFGGIGGLALAFASQEVISNFFGGLMIYFTHPFSIGDWIKLPERNLEGYVEEIGWYMTLIRNFEKRPIYVPNSIFTKVIVINPSRMTHRQIEKTFGIRYSDEPVLKKIILDIKEMLSKHPAIDQVIPFTVHFEGFGSSSLDIKASAYTLVIDNEEFADIKQDILLKIGEIILNNNANFAFATHTIEMSPSAVSLRP